jgi:CheW-like domain
MSAPPNPAELVLLRIGPCVLALARREVRDLVEPPPRSAKQPAAGGSTVRFNDTDLPLLALDDALQRVLDAPAPHRRICVVLETAGQAFGLLCDEFEHRIAAPPDTVKLHALPAAMRTPGAPVQAVLQIGDTVALVTTAQLVAEAFALPARAELEPA